MTDGSSLSATGSPRGRGLNACVIERLRQNNPEPARRRAGSGERKERGSGKGVRQPRVVQSSDLNSEIRASMVFLASPSTIELLGR